MLIGLLVLSVLVVSCTQGTLAGQASGLAASSETRCDGRDDNRNRVIDEGCDDDGDKYCDSSMTLVGTPRVCPNGGGDCQDTNSAFHPGATDECAPTYVDLNCDGTLSCAPVTSGTQCESLGWGSYCDLLLEGETKNYRIGEDSYDVTLTMVGSIGGVLQTRLTVNGNTTESMIDDQIVLIAGRTLQVTNILFQEYAGGVHHTTFCMG